MLTRFLDKLGFSPRSAELDDFRSIYLEHADDGSWFVTGWIIVDKQVKGDDRRRYVEGKGSTVEAALAQIIVKVRYPDLKDIPDV